MVCDVLTVPWQVLRPMLFQVFSAARNARAARRSPEGFEPVDRRVCQAARALLPEGVRGDVLLDRVRCEGLWTQARACHLEGTDSSCPWCGGPIEDAMHRLWQ
eukprot:13443253-Alexandrium_andersonii.AAC.1